MIPEDLNIGQTENSILWIDAKVAGKDLPMGLTVGLQGGQNDDGSAFGVKVGMKPIKPLYLQVAYSSADEDFAVGNATGVKSPFYTQMIYNQGFIKLDSDTMVAKAAYNTGSTGTLIAQYGMSTYNASTTENEYTELDLIYKVKSGGVTYWASAMLRDIDGYADNKVRLWARLGF